MYLGKVLVLILLIIVGVCPRFANAQHSRAVDSLNVLLGNASEDTSKIDFLVKISDEYLDNDLDKAEEYIDKASNMAQNIEDTLRILWCIRDKSVILEKKGDTDAAFDQLERGLEIGKRHNNGKVLSALYRQIGWIHELRADYLKALTCFEEELKIEKELDNKEGISIAYNNIGIVYEELGQYDEAIKYLTYSLDIAREINDDVGVSNALNNLGLVYDYQGDNENAFNYYNQSLQIEEQKGNKEGIMNGKINIGTMHQKLGNYQKAIECFNKSLVISKEIGDRYGMAICFNNIGEVHQLQGNYDIALTYFKKSLEIDEERGDKDDIAISLMNIGDVSIYLKNYNEALDYLTRALEISQEIGDKSSVASSLSSLGFLMMKQGQFQASLYRFNEALDIHLSLGEKDKISYDRIKIGEIHYKLNNFSEAETQALKGLQMARHYGTKEDIKSAAKLLSEIYAASNHFQKAYKYHLIYKEIYDSIFTLESKKRLSAIESRYELESKQQQIEQQKATIEQQRTHQMVLVIGFFAVLLAVIVAVVAYFRIRKAKNIIDYQQREILESNEELRQINEELRTTIETVNNQKEQIEAQRDKIEAANQEVTASIRYAKYIQTAILPHQKTRNSMLQSHFVYFRPKNIVSGDFYWLTKINKKTILAVADCTGHGVPGAFMSMLGMSYLNDVVNKEGVTNPAKILERLREEVIKALHQKGTPGETRDGMDVAICTIDYSSMQLQFAGANNSLYIIRAGEAQVVGGEVTDKMDDYVLYDLKGDKATIAFDNTMLPFQTHELPLLEGDRLYMFSDGFPDQFGGKTGKRFKFENFKKLLLKNRDMEMAEQSELLEEAFQKWKGNHEQIDDVLVMGIEIKET